MLDSLTRVRLHLVVSQLLQLRQAWMTTSELVVVGGRRRDVFVGQFDCYNRVVDTDHFVSLTVLKLGDRCVTES